MDVLSHNQLSWFPDLWCTMEINLPTCSQKEHEDTCGKAEGHINPLYGFQRCSPSAFMLTLRVAKWTQIWLLGPNGVVIHPKAGRREAALCLCSQMLCWCNKHLFSNSGKAGVMPMTFPPEIMTGMTPLLMTYWCRQKSEMNNVIHLFQRAKDCARRDSPPPRTPTSPPPHTPPPKKK